MRLVREPRDITSRHAEAALLEFWSTRLSARGSFLRIRLLLVSYSPLAGLISARVRVVGAIRQMHALSAAEDSLVVLVFSRYLV